MPLYATRTARLLPYRENKQTPIGKLTAPQSTVVAQPGNTRLSHLCLPLENRCDELPTFLGVSWGLIH
jgi:hypothetical protein